MAAAFACRAETVVQAILLVCLFVRLLGLSSESEIPEISVDILDETRAILENTAVI